MTTIKIDDVHYSPLALLKSVLFGDVGWGEEFVKGNILVRDNRLIDFIEKNRGAKRLLPYFRQFNNGSDVHYNLPAEFFEKLLGKSMSYTCANFNGTDDLDHAQAYKHGWHKQNLNLTDDCKLLECGSGWGGFRRYLANDVADYEGLTISQEQIDFCDVFLTDRAGSFKLCDWRDACSAYNHAFDRFVSIGMIEHVGLDNLPYFFEWVRSSLTRNGIGTLQFISRDKPISPWADKYIFNGAQPPNFNEVSRLMRQNGLIITEHVERGGDYVLTLEAWLSNLERHRSWIVDKFGINFFRMFELYLSGGIVSFKSGDSQLMQLRFEVQG